MSFIIGEMSQPTSNAPDIDPGAYVGPFVQLLDLGTHWNKPFSAGQKGAYRKRLRLGWELPEVLNEDGKPIIMGRTFYNVNMGSEAKPTDWAKFLKGWLGKELSPELDLSKKLGSSSTLIFTLEKKADKDRLVLSSASPLRPGVKHPAPVNNLITFSATPECFDNDLAKLPDWIQAIIKESVEYRVHMGKELADIYAEDGADISEPRKDADKGFDEILDDDIPL